MKKFIPMTRYEIDSAKQAIDILDIVKQAGVELTKQGKRYVGLCPIHDENTPSFKVNPVSQTFKCFGCQASGDVIDFVMKNNSVSFPIALERLGIVSTTPKTKVEINREFKSQKRRKKKESFRNKLIDEFETWVEQYKLELVEWIEILEKSIQMLTWDHMLELSDLIKQKSIWQYHAWLITTVADADIIYELYLEKNGGF